MFNILVAEDDNALRQLFCKVLEKNGFNPIEAYDGINALEKLDEHYIDLVICDLMMPRMDGIQMVMQLRKEHDFPVIMLSAKSEEVDKIMGLNMGADDYVTKPFDIEEKLSCLTLNLSGKTPKS